MAIRKTGDAEKLGVAYFGEEAGIVNEHLQKVGKSVVDFSADEQKALEKDLQAFRTSNKETADDTPTADVANNEDEEE